LKVNIRHYMSLQDAKREIDKLMLKHLDRSDVACLVLSWGTLSKEDMEEACWYLHEWKPVKEADINKQLKSSGRL